MASPRVALRFATTVALNVLESELEKICKQDFSLKLEGMADDLVKKVVVISFSDEADKDLFKSEYKRISKAS